MIVDEGIVITNKHVIEGVEHVECNTRTKAG